MSYAGLVRPVVDRVYVGARQAARSRITAYYAERGLRPGFEVSFNFGLLARPMPARALDDVLVYVGADMSAELAQGVAEVDADGAWRLTGLGRELAAAVQRMTGEAAEERWAAAPAYLPGLAAVPRLADLVGRLLAHGLTTGGTGFRAMAPVYEPPDASPALRLTSRLGALRHHRGDAHRAAWRAAGLTVAEITALPDGSARRAIEAETDRLDEPVYAALTAEERLELLAGLGALPG
ncbi:hypothetical protein GA0070609_4554 [Micromonospora echinaurantiaca]|uniref:Uncharacterized protein n=1 Tax=Micromonospora echinaurantiaca TaxID=47857 RepID=A0A1C5JKD7_9ACTN|nr:hypothetical protein [Micromonospora echinaurantiaca]SCG71015.1 hypothetical protein GA0070609_4554 [Micromonospora echinaurantiaca]